MGRFHVLRRYGRGTAGCLCSSQSNAAVSGRPLRSYNPASCLKGHAGGPPPRREEWRDREDWHSLHVGPEGIDRPRWEGGSEHGPTPTRGARAPPRARTVDRPRRVPIDTRDGERNVGWKEGGREGQCNVGPRQAVSSTVDRPVAAVSSQLLSRPSCDDGLICVN